MKKIHSINITCFILVFLLVAMNIQVFGDTVVNVTSISLNKITDNLAVGGTDTLVATVNPPTATNQAVTWMSNNTSVVNVFNGVVMGISAGTAVVTAISADGSRSASCMVVVSAAATSVTLNKTSLNLSIWGSDTLTATVNQGTTATQAVTWASSDESIVKVNNGLVIAMGAGTAVVTATAVNGGAVASCVVKVSSPIISINLNKIADYLTVGTSDVLTVTVNPPTATTQTVTWASSNTAVVQVTDGVIVAASAGTATVTATTTDGTKNASCEVTVNGVGASTYTITSISLNKVTDSLVVGSTDILTVAVNPTTATNQAMLWSSSNPAVASVVNGVVVALSTGTAFITATSVDGSKTASCLITVTATAASTPTSNVNIVRLGGADRYATSTAISQAGWTGTISYAVLATANDYPDALSAAPLAKQKNAPILLTDKSSVPPAVLAELARLKVTYVFIIGGTGVITGDVEKQLKAAGITTERLAGSDRAETSIKVAEKLGAVAGEIMVANGSSWEEALSASSIAAKKGIPIILTNKDTLPNSVSTFISKYNFSKSYILGDTDLISDNVANKFPSRERIIGSNQYERNINIIKRFESDINFNNICVATGKNFPDALSGSALAAMLSTAIVLVDDSNLNSTTTQYINGKLTQIKSTYVFGLQGAVSDAGANKLLGK